MELIRVVIWCLARFKPSLICLIFIHLQVLRPVNINLGRMSHDLLLISPSPKG